MTYKIKILALIGAVITAPVFAAESSNALSNNIKDLTGQINQINQDLAAKQQKQQQIAAALKDSQSAITKSQALLAKLRKQRDGDLQQLQQLSAAIPQMESATVQAKALVTQSINQIYSQINKINSHPDSLFAANSSLDDERKKIYLTELLKVEQGKYQQLNQKLVQLQNLNARLQAEVTRLDKQLGEKNQQHQQLVQTTQEKTQQVIAVKQQIDQEKKQLNHLKQRQAQLNKLLKQIADAERKQQLAAKKAAAAAAQQKKIAAANTNNGNNSANNTNSTAQQPPVVTKPINSASIDTSFEDNSPFLSRKLAKPVSGKIVVGFGQMRDSVRNNGVLLQVTDNTPIFAMSNGTVLFSGELPGFGQIIVIDHGDNYTSVYSGVLAQVGKGSRVKTGQQIASSGGENNQPMGGIYIELRHLGKPVNPTSAFN